MTAERDWDEAFSDITSALMAATAWCRGCGIVIHQSARGEWEDELGLIACVKGQPRPLAEVIPGESVFTVPVTHEPMPHGLSGAPG